ncbi:MAG: hypothetical protein HQM15_01985 [Deltaproteobacteria bacterium]|nr:hypothetical protein [Deltaproteobacteria bacterium]
MAPINETNSRVRITTEPPLLVPIAAPQTPVITSIADSIFTHGRKTGAEIYHGALTGSTRLFGRVEHFVERLLDNVEEAASSTLHRIEDALSESLGLEEAPATAAQMTPLGGPQRSTLYSKTGLLSSAFKSQGLQGPAGPTNSSFVVDRLATANTAAITPDAVLARSLLNYLTGTSEARPANTTAANGHIAPVSSPSCFVSSFVSTFITPFAQATMEIVAAPARLALSLEHYLQTQYDPFPTRTAALNFTAQLNPVSAPALLSSIPEENDLLHSFVTRTGKTLSELREAIRGERFFVYKSFREENTSQARADQADSPRPLSPWRGLDLAISGDAQGNAQATDIHRGWNNQTAVANGRAVEENLPGSSVVTNAIAINLAAQGSRVRDTSPVHFGLMLSRLDGEHQRVEANAASSHSGSGEHRDSSNGSGSRDPQQQNESEIASEDTLPESPAPARLPAGDLQASVFSLA